MKLGAFAIRKWRAVRRHQGLTVAIFLPLAAVATWMMLHPPNEFAATTQVRFLPRDAAGELPSFPFSPPGDETYADLSRHFGLYPGFLRRYAVHWVASRSAVKLTDSSPAGGKYLNVTFTDRSADRASAVSFELAKSVALATVERWQKQQRNALAVLPPVPVVPAPQAEPVQTQTPEETQLQEDLSKDEELHQKLQQQKTQLSLSRYRLAALSAEERRIMASQLNEQIAEVERQRIVLQRQIAANREEEATLRKEIAKQPPQDAAPVSPVPAPVTVPSLETKIFPWTFAISPDTAVERLQPAWTRVWIRGLFLPAAIVLTLLIVFAIDRFDGTLKREAALRRQLTEQARYLGAIPRIRHETIYR